VTTVRVVHAQGDPAQRGREIGRSLGDLIERSLAFYQGYLERRGIAAAQLEESLTPHLRAAAQTLPQYVEMIRGLAAGAMASFWEVFAINAFEELDPLFPPDAFSFLDRTVGRPGPDGWPWRGSPERCSSFAVSGEGFTLLGHNEQWLAGDQGNVAVVIEHPDDGSPAIASPTVVCCLPAVGMNEHRGAQAIQSLAASDDGQGLPRVLVSRHSLASADRVDAVRRATIRGRAGGYGHVFAFPGDAFTLETSARRYSLLSGSGPHTNHYLDPALAAQAEPPSAGSAARYARLLELIEERQPDTPEAAMEILKDHGSRPQSICLHADGGAGEEGEAILFSMVCDVETGRMWLALGNPCVTPYEEIDLAGLI
jgi:isopenicillin-N N-acyltransferase like protein